MLVTIIDDIYDGVEYEKVYADIADVRLVTTIRHLLEYVISTKKGDLSHFQKAQVIELENYLLFDVHTKKNLELTETMRLRERTYSLLWLLDKTKTAMGSRMLKNWLLRPLKNQDLIEWYKKLGEIRHTNKCFVDGRLEILSAVAGCVAYSRRNEDNAVLIISNSNPHPITYYVRDEWSDAEDLLGNSYVRGTLVDVGAKSTVILRRM